MFFRSLSEKLLLIIILMYLLVLQSKTSLLNGFPPGENIHLKQDGRSYLGHMEAFSFYR